MSAQAWPADSHDERRVDSRHAVAFPPMLLEGEATREHVHLVNVARRGFLARALARYRTGETVLLHWGGKPVEARIVWCAGGRIGGRFAEPIAIGGFASV